MASVVLRDGRQLAYQKFAGNPAPTNRFAILFFPGDPGNRGFFPQGHAQLCADHHQSVFVLDRPGFGMSSFHKEHTLISWVDDVKQFIELIGLRKVVVIGYSAGGPYALACAALLPQDVLLGVVIIATVGPKETPHIYQGMSLEFKVGWWLCVHQSGLIKSIVKNSHKHSIKNPEKSVISEFASYSVIDRTALAQNERGCRDLFVESVKVNSTNEHFVAARTRLLLLFGQHWGFQLDSIRCPVRQFAGLQDFGSVPNIARHMQKSIPHCETTFVENAGHLLFFREDVWKQVVEAVDQFQTGSTQSVAQEA